MAELDITDFEAWQAEARRKAEDVAWLTGWQLPVGWAIGPVGQHRDSDVLDVSNFAVALVAMGGEGDDVEVVRFRHWACGWVEEIAFRMGGEAAEIAHLLSVALEDYPALSDEDFSEREWEADHPDDGSERCYSEYCHQQGECSLGWDAA
jgi:hypothetical protein